MAGGVVPAPLLDVSTSPSALLALCFVSLIDVVQALLLDFPSAELILALVCFEGAIAGDRSLCSGGFTVG
jgi:hypothetical protein